jgi:RNA-directed DNA polymerase
MTAAKYFFQQYKPENLRTLYEEHIALTSAVGIDRLNRVNFEKKLDDEITLINRRVAVGAYKFSQYREKLILKGAGKIPRVISIPTFRDRITLRALCNVLKNTFRGQLDVKLPQHTVAEVREGLASGAFTHFLKLDVTAFYPSIDHATLHKTLNKKVRKIEIRQLIISAIETSTVPYPDRAREKSDNGVPQGLAISNILAEIYLSRFDVWAGALGDVAYFRYVDDVLILAKDDPTSLFDTIKQKLSHEFCLDVHNLGSLGKSVVGTIADKFNFLGYQFEHGKASVKPDSIYRLEGSLARILTTYKYKCVAARAISNVAEQNLLLARARKICLWRLNLRITGCLFETVRRGWVFYFSQIDDEAISQLHNLDMTVKALIRRFAFTPETNELKSFVRSFHESKRSILCHRFIPNFDTTSVAEQRDFLNMYGVEDVVTMTDVQVTRVFKRRIRRETSELEQDIQGGSRG